MKTVCIYHFPCPDGFSSAWVVNLKYLAKEHIGFYPMMYGDPIPDLTGKDVIMVDFSLKAVDMLILLEKANSVLVIDHHKTAEAELDQLNHPKLTCIFDMEHSGAVLTWKHFFPKEPVPMLLKYIEDRDLWKWKLPHSREISSALSSYPYDFETWDQLDVKVDLQFNELLIEGRTLQRQFNKTITEILESTKRFGKVFGHTVPVANVNHMFGSDGGNILCKGYPFALLYYDTPKDRKFSLRSTFIDNKFGIDVSEIAKKIPGGGGHPNAAGFSLPWGVKHPDIDIGV
jgi:hypothetical protein